MVQNENEFRSMEKEKQEGVSATRGIVYAALASIAFYAVVIWAFVQVIG